MVVTTLGELRLFAPKAAVGATLLAAIGAWMSYTFYWSDFGSSLFPFYVGLSIMAIAFLTPFLAYFACARLGYLSAVPMGILGLVILATLYYIFGLSTFLFYIIYAPLPTAVQVMGYVVGIGGHVWWLSLTWADLRNALEKSNFEGLAYEPRDGLLYFDRQNWGRRISKLMDKRGIPHQGQVWVALVLAPAAPFIGRLFSDDFRSLGVATILAYLSLPLGLWILRASFFPFVSLIWYPLKLKRQTGKTVVLVS